MGSGAKVQLELGGKNPLVVTEHADLGIAVECAMQGGFGSTGQRCTASSIVMVTDGVHDALRLGGGGAPCPPGGSATPARSASKWGRSSTRASSSRTCGTSTWPGAGRRGHRRRVWSRSRRGHYLAPALAVGTAITDTINREEVFGPVVSVVRVADYVQALADANATTMNLSAGICTTDLAEASHFKRHSKAGMVMVNLPTAGVDFHVPFGGRGESSHGPREQGTPPSSSSPPRRRPTPPRQPLTFSTRVAPGVAHSIGP